MNIWKFSIFTFAGSFPWSFGLAYGGFLLGENWVALRSAMRPFDIPIVILVVLGVGWFLYRRIKSLRAASARQRSGLITPDQSPGDDPGGVPPFPEP